LKVFTGSSDSIVGYIDTTTNLYSLPGVVSPALGGTGVANNAAATLTRSGNHALTLTTTGTTSLTLPTTGTLATLAGTETQTNKTLTAPIIIGRTTAAATAASNIGEVITAQLASGAATALTNGVGKTVTTIVLTAGWWRVTGTVAFTSTATTSVQTRGASISATTNTFGTLGAHGTELRAAAGNVNGGFTESAYTGDVELYFASNTNIFLVAQSSFTVSTSSAYGTITAVRIQK
jgi:hypothetical protein